MSNWRDYVYDDTYVGPRWTYGLQYRPLHSSHVPPGWIIRSNRAHPDFPHGTVDYPAPLTPEQVRGYELIVIASP